MPDDPSATRTRPPGGFDPARLRRLLDLTGPEIAPTLLAQFVADLTACRDAVGAALATPDWALLRRASHDLIALAGSCGAGALHDMASAANDLAHAQNLPALVALRAALDEELAATIAMLSATPATRGGAW